MKLFERIKIAIQIWWYGRDEWIQRELDKLEKLYPIVDEPEPEPVDPLVQRYADYMTVEAKKWEDEHHMISKTYKQHIEENNEASSWFVGVIPHNWVELIDKKIEEKNNANESNTK